MSDRLPRLPADLAARGTAALLDVVFQAQERQPWDDNLLVRHVVHILVDRIGALEERVAVLEVKGGDEI